jgi:hypothetical protein
MAIITLGTGGYIVKREGIADLQNHVSRLNTVSGITPPLYLYSSRKLKCKSVMHEQVSVAYGL